MNFKFVDVFGFLFDYLLTTIYTVYKFLLPKLTTSKDKTVLKMSDNDYATKEKQEARAFLRERFLRMIPALNGKSAVLRTYEEPKKEGIFCGSDLHVCHFYIKQFKTPHGTIPHALVRTADIIDMHVDNVI